MRRPGIVEYYRLAPVRDINTLFIEAVCISEIHILIKLISVLTMVMPDMSG